MEDESDTHGPSGAAPAHGSKPWARRSSLLNVASGRKPWRNVPKAEKKRCVSSPVAAKSSGAGTNTNCVPWLRTRIHSVLEKKKNLFLTKGPPAETPNWFRSKAGCGMPLALFSKLLEANFDVRLNS
jgi:hypothetical protein